MASAISGFINQIRTAIYGEQVRGAIVSALEQCYSDVNAPSLQTEAFETALNEAYAGGILDIQTVTSFSAMTNQKIIYRYNGTAAGKQKGLYYFSALSDSWVLIGSEIQKVSLLSQMTDTNDIYKYIGTESGMVQNSLYCYNGTTWVPIGSGVLTAATAAGMTNQNAIYKYTGSETGYITNSLYYYNGTAWTPLSQTTVSEFTQANVGKPADAYAVGLALENVLSTNLKNALLDCFAHVAWIDQNGQQYINTLYAELFGGSGRLPTGYREVEWIQPTGQQSNSIVIPLDLQSATISFEIGFTLATTFYNEQDIFTIANSSTTEPAILSYINQNSKLGAYSRGGSSADTNAIVTIPTTGDIDFSCEYDETNETKTITFDGTTASAVNKAKLSYLGSNLILFNGFRQTNNPFLQKFRFMRVESSGLSLDLVPCVRSNNAIGVFDLENEVFYAASAGTFEVGPTAIYEG